MTDSEEVFDFDRKSISLHEANKLNIHPLLQ